MSKLPTKLTSRSVSSTILNYPSIVSSIIASSASLRGSKLCLISSGWKITRSCVFGGSRKLHEFIIGIDFGNYIFKAELVKLDEIPAHNTEYDEPMPRSKA